MPAVATSLPLATLRAGAPAADGARGRWLAALLAASIAVSAGCKAVKPLNDRNWVVNEATLPVAEIHGDQATIRNIRNCQYLSKDDFVLNYYDKTFDLRQLESVDFVVVPFQGTPALAHTMLSFGFRDQDPLAVSVEIRKEQGQKYSAVKGSLRQYELIYVVGDERDLIKVRTNYRMDDVYLYHSQATPEQCRALFVDVMRRVNQLRERPEFYDTLTNNCTLNLVNHVNHIHPGRIRYGPKLLINGYSDELAYELGLIDTSVPFEEARRRAYISEKARRVTDDADFSRAIRR